MDFDPRSSGECRQELRRMGDRVRPLASLKIILRRRDNQTDEGDCRREREPTAMEERAGFGTLSEEFDLA
jgi:hypothetical protein